MRWPELVLLGALGLALPAWAEERSAALAAPVAASGAASAPIDAETVRAVAAAVYADPRLNRLEASRDLRLKPSNEDPQDPSDNGSWKTFVEWLAEAGRWVIWLLGAIAVALLVLRLARWVRERADAPAAGTLALPSHVRDLDIRPESLPDDVGAAARALWLAGAARAALSLLHRGALSRLVHEQGVPIREATTEGECVRLAERHLPETGHRYVAQLVRLWQRAVYGAHPADGDDVLGLCATFESCLPRRAAVAASANTA